MWVNVEHNPISMQLLLTLLSKTTPERNNVALIDYD